MNNISEIGWGMAILAHTYRQLRLASRSEVKGIAGYLTLLVAWIVKHFPHCARVVPNMEYNETLPRVCKWRPQQSSGNAITGIIQLREIVDDLSELDVCWDSYKDHMDAHPFHGVSYYCGLLACFDIVQPYYPERVLRQFGRVQTIPTLPMIPSHEVKAMKDH